MILTDFDEELKINDVPRERERRGAGLVSFMSHTLKTKTKEIPMNLVIQNK